MGAQFARSTDRVAVRDEAGFFGYFAGDKIVLDLWALGDPLLARIPFRPDSRWRVGHYTRPLPAGYLASRREGRNRIADPELAALHDGLALVTGGPVFDSARWREIWRLHTGHYGAVLRRHAGDGTNAVRPATFRED
jgi:arabinofuranosyltransferase